MVYDPWKLESGLIDDTDLVIRDAVFTHRLDAFDPTKLELHLTVKPADEDETTLYLGCGDGWETNDDGATAVRTDGAERNFHQNTKTGEFFGGLVKCMAADQKVDKAVRAHGANFPLGPRDAAFWKGLDVHVTRVERKGGGDVGDYQLLVIDGFNGIEGASTGGGKAAAPAKKATKKAAAGKAKAADADDGMTDEIRATLDAIADACGEHDEFMERALAEVPEASSNVAVKEAVSATGPGSIWQDAIDRYNAQAG